MKKRGNTRHILITAAMGVVFFIIGELLYPLLFETLWSPLGMALYIGIFGVILCFVMYRLNVARRDYDYWYKFKKAKNISASYKSAFAWLLVLVLLTGTFEFIYELGQNQMAKPTSYVFVIDDSGSMQSSDPETKRAQAIGTIMADQPTDFPYAVYRFTGGAELVKDMSPYSSADSYEFASNGGTDILGSLNRVVDDLTSGKLNGGSAPRILLLSDGASSSWGKRGAIVKCRNNGISISSISFSINSPLLKSLAENTGGIYIRVDDINQLQTEMQTAVETQQERNLISPRVMIKRNGLYAILRVLFLALLGVLWSWIKYLTHCSSKRENDGNVFKTSIVLCTAAALLTELLFAVGMVSWVVHLLFCVLWAITPGEFLEKKTVVFDPQYVRGNDENGSNGNGIGDEVLEEKKKAEEGGIRVLGGPNNTSQDAEKTAGNQVEGGFGLAGGLNDTNNSDEPMGGFGADVGGFGATTGFGEAMGGFEEAKGGFGNESNE